MKSYSGKVPQWFVEYRDKKVKEDSRQFLPETHKGYMTKNKLYFNWDCEWVEHDQAFKHDHLELSEKRFEYDLYDLLTKLRLDYKHLAKDGLFIGDKVKKRIQNNKVDSIVPWSYNKSRWRRGDKYPIYQPLQVDEIVDYTVYEPEDANFVLNELNEKNRFTLPLK